MKDETGAKVAGGLLPQITRITADSDEYDPRRGPVDMRPAASLTLTAPMELGSFLWTLTVPEHVIDNVRHQAASLQFALATRPHEVSVAVWDNPTPVSLGNSFAVKIGAKCSAGCSLAGEVVEVMDAEGGVIARTRLGEAPWRATRALYWTAADVVAPSLPGHFRWSARMAPLQRTIPHTVPGRASFSFLAVAPAEHSVRIELLEQGKEAPVEGAQARLGPHRAATDESGVVTFEVARGEYALSIWKNNYEIPTSALRVDGDLKLKIEAKALPEDDPYSFYWKRKPARRSLS
jgi:hypothetical protein